MSMPIDFHEQLSDQLKFIRASCDLYDAGHKREGVRIATSIRIICHQTRRSLSLLTHLRATEIKLLSTCDMRRPEQHYFPAMTNILLDPANKRFEWQPKLKTHYERPVPFNEWWFRESVYFSKDDDIDLSRADLVKGAANKDGGAHVDTALEPRYEQILQGFGWSMTVNPDGEPSQEIPCRYGHLAALRQMGYELLNSPELLALL